MKTRELGDGGGNEMHERETFQSKKKKKKKRILQLEEGRFFLFTTPL